VSADGTIVPSSASFTNDGAVKAAHESAADLCKLGYILGEKRELYNCASAIHWAGLASKRQRTGQYIRIHWLKNLDGAATIACGL
jgi:hypothetical protein